MNDYWYSELSEKEALRAIKYKLQKYLDENREIKMIQTVAFVLQRGKFT